MTGETTTAEAEERNCFDIALDAVNELETFVLLCWEGLGFTEAAREVAEVLKEARARRRDTAATSATSETRVEQIEKLEKFACKCQKPIRSRR